MYVFPVCVNQATSRSQRGLGVRPALAVLAGAAAGAQSTRIC